MKILFSSLLCVAILGFSGCGDSDDDNETSSASNEVISNIGNNINGLGYYGDGVKFGNEDVVGYFKNYFISEDGEVLNDYAIDSIQHTSDGDLMIAVNNSYMYNGTYSVNEDGTILYENTINYNSIVDYTYIGDITITNTETGEKQNCLKVRTFYNGDYDYFARCSIK